VSCRFCICEVCLETGRARLTLDCLVGQAISSPAGLDNTMYWERRLPHWIPEDTPIFVTWRLAGTFPSGAGGLAACQSPACTPSWMDSDAQLDHAESGPRWLAQPAVARIVTQALHYGVAARNWYRLHAWVIMPNHVHIVMTPKHGFSETMRWLKWTTARRANQILERRGMPFWQDECFDHWIRDQQDFERIVRYVEWNPVAAGLVESSEQWPWSSAKASFQRQATRSPAPPCFKRQATRSPAPPEM
jgi:putative transposase